MKLSVDGRDLQHTSADLLVIPLAKRDPESWKLPARITALDRELGGVISTALATGDFRGASGDALPLYAPNGSEPQRLLLLGLGEEDKIDLQKLRRAAGSAVRRAATKKASSVCLAVPRLRRIKTPASAQALAEGAVLGGYRFDRHRAAQKDGPGDVETVRLAYERLPDAGPTRSAAKRGVVIATGQNLARDLSNEPPNVLPPAGLAKEAQKMARASGLKCKVMEVAELERRGMGGILAVGQGSANPPRLIVMEHNAPPKSKTKRGSRQKPTVCIVGKGITFDTGGISIKPAGNMDEMKHDMSGAAAVIGAMQVVAELKLPLHVVGVVAAAENMPSGTAYRPGDVITTLSGKTVEILNTDAEGRVVLADALHYANTEFDPKAIVDLATLTGACMIALGPWATGTFSNHDGLSDRIRSAGEASGERAWPMPLLEEHKEAMRSQVADLKNAGARHAGASTAAGFLAAFVGETPWTHMDIAGTGWTSTNTPIQPKGATGVGVRLLIELLRGWSAKSPV